MGGYTHACVGGGGGPDSDDWGETFLLREQMVRRCSGIGKDLFHYPPRRYFETYKEARNQFQGIDSASLCSLAGW